MTRQIGAILAVWLAWAGAAAAGERGVLVELFTSQGCSACPPADELLVELAERKGVIALALHVDYWDYIGWKDSFAQPRFTERQKKYAYAAQQRSVFTPQMIVAGRERVMGARPMKVMDLIRAHAEAPAPVTIDLSREAERLRVALRPEHPVGAADIHLVRYEPSASVSITRGENAGRRFAYHNIVTDWRVLGQWDGTAPLTVETAAGGDRPIVVIVQRRGHGPVLAAARLR